MPTAAVDSQMGVVRTIKALRARVEQWRSNGLTVAFAPTMGALHEGHLSLVKKALTLADRTVVSIFVNPRQFAAHEDLGKYPRTEARDIELLQRAGCHLAYIPDPQEIYPDGYQTSISVGALSEGLCGASRPHFFGGVATVVCKLLNQCRPNVAIFGEKDFQQLAIIKRMVRDLDMGIDIVGAPIVREKDGLAMSSRNVYLSADERTLAGKLNGILAETAEALGRGVAVAVAVQEGRAKLGAAGFSDVDYFEVRHAADLNPAANGPIEREARVFAAVIVGGTRLIDNWPVTLVA